MTLSGHGDDDDGEVLVMIKMRVGDLYSNDDHQYISIIHQVGSQGHFS